MLRLGMVSIPIFLMAMVLLSVGSAAAEDFSVSPAEFTVRDAPPLGEPWTIPEKIIIWNGDNIERLFSISVEVPPENAVRPGYEPIPQADWVVPVPSSVTIPENSFAEISISMNIPAWENLTGQKWEVWIPVERGAKPGEITLRNVVRVKIETTEELPAGGGGRGFPVLLVLGISIVSAIVAAVAWLWLGGR